MQFKASLSGASSGSGNDGWCRKVNSRLVIASTRVSRFSKAVSLVLRISFAEKRLKMSSEDSGSSHHYEVSCQQAGDDDEGSHIPRPSTDRLRQ